MSKPTKRHIGIYPGTFDPVHPGHIAFANETMRVCRLDEVVFLPEQKPRGKSGVTDILHRIALIERTTMGQAGLHTKQLTSKQFTIFRTLPELHKVYSGCHFTFLIGSDIAKSLQQWEGIATLLSTSSLAVGMRSTDNSDEIMAVLEQLTATHKTPINYTFIKTTEADMTSSQIRNGSTDLSRLPIETRTYIEQHRLYR